MGMLGGASLITTVVTAAKTYDLTDLKTVKLELGIDGSADDAFLAMAITAASTAAANYCNRVFPVETVLDEFWPQRDPYPPVIPGGVDPLQLSRWPIVSQGVASVAENSIALVDGTDYRVNYPVGQLVRLNQVGYPRQWPALPLAVQYAAGFAIIPAEVVQGVIALVRLRWFARKRDPMLRSQNVEGIYQAQYWISAMSPGNIPPEIAGALDPYRVNAFG